MIPAVECDGVREGKKIESVRAREGDKRGLRERER